MLSDRINLSQPRNENGERETEIGRNKHTKEIGYPGYRT